MKVKIVTALVVVLTLSLLVVFIPPAKAQFILASWDYPDEYGQGITTIGINGNATGSFLTVFIHHYDDTSDVYEWDAGVAIKLECYVYMNSTLTGAIDTADGQNYIRLSVTVAEANGTIIFSQEGFTYLTVDTVNDPLWFYSYSVILNFLPQYSHVYTVTVTYEVYY